jgi:hypothetical protein
MHHNEGGQFDGEHDAKRLEKTKKWLKAVDEIKEVKDLLGKPIEEHIRDTVVGLNVLEIPTSGSCEGHIDRAIPAPWVYIQADNRPQERFVGEEATFEATAKKYGIPTEEVLRAKNHDAWVEATVAGDNGEETAEYLEWRKKNDQLRMRVQELLDNFYQERIVDAAARIQIDQRAEGIRIHNGGEDYTRKTSHSLSDEERRALAIRLKEYQAEMQTFADFLRDKYLDSE